MFEDIQKLISFIMTKVNVKIKFHLITLRFLVIIIILPITYQASSQSFNYGLKVGIGSFNQNWEFDNLPFSGWKKDKTGLMAYVFGELNHSNHFGTKLEFGYLKKGYYNDLSIEGPDGTIYQKSSSYTKDFNTFYLGLSERITFFKSKLRPYIKMGVNLQLIPKREIENDYLIVVDNTGQLLWLGGQNIYSTNVDWNNLTLNANTGLGLTYKDLFFIEFEYSPAITPLLNIDYVKVIDRYFGLSIGLNINNLY